MPIAVLLGLAISASAELLWFNGDFDTDEGLDCCKGEFTWNPGVGTYRTELDMDLGRFTVGSGVYWFTVLPDSVTDNYYYWGRTPARQLDYCVTRDGDPDWGGAYGHYDWQHDFDTDVSFELHGHQSATVTEPATWTRIKGLYR